MCCNNGHATSKRVERRPDTMPADVPRARFSNERIAQALVCGLEPSEPAVRGDSAAENGVAEVPRNSHVEPICNWSPLWSTLAAPKWCAHSVAPRLADRSRDEPTVNHFRSVG